MAATVSSVWAKPGAWALDSEEHEDELNQQIMAKPAKPEPPAADFPSLAAAASAKPKKKNKGQTLSLADFNSYSAPKPAAEPKGLTQDELLMLPTGPREKTAEELERPRLGGGFRNYGGGMGDNSRVRFSDRNRDGNSNRDRDMGPSRADEVDDWSKTKKFNGGASERTDRRDKVGFFNSSRADEVDNWAANKSFVAPSEGPRRERRMGFESYSNGSGPDSGSWSKNKEERGGGHGGAEADTWGRRESIGPVSGAGRPRLNLQPRTLPVVNITPNNGGQSVTPNNGGQSVTPTEPKQKAANPFGEARPREEVLAEKGKDWKEIDEKLDAVKMKEVGNGDKTEGFGKRRGFGIGKPDSGDEKTVRSWRKPDSTEAVPSPSGSSADTTENTASAADSTVESAEKVPEEN